MHLYMYVYVYIYFFLNSVLSLEILHLYAYKWDWLINFFLCSCLVGVKITQVSKEKLGTFAFHFLK